MNRRTRFGLAWYSLLSVAACGTDARLAADAARDEGADVAVDRRGVDAEPERADGRGDAGDRAESDAGDGDVLPDGTPPDTADAAAVDRADAVAARHDAADRPGDAAGDGRTGEVGPPDVREATGLDRVDGARDAGADEAAIADAGGDAGARGCTDVPLLPNSGATGYTSGESTYEGSCGGSRAPEAVWAYVVDRPLARLAIETLGSGLDTVLYLRLGDCETGTQVACNDDCGGGRTYSCIIRSSPAMGTYYVFVDGWATSAGRYRLILWGDIAAGGRCDPAEDNFRCQRPLACVDGICR